MKRRLTALVLSCLLLPLAGCWDHLEINKTLIIAGVGLDVGAGGEGYHATVEVIDVSASRGENITSSIVEGGGDTIQSALVDAMETTGGVLFGNHCKVVVLGEELARRGIHPALEALLRSPNFRKTVDLLVARGETARSILTGKTVSNDILSYELDRITDSNARTHQTTILTGAYELHELLLSDCPYAVVPAVFPRENNGEPVLQVDGCALFSGGVLSGFLDGGQVPLLRLLTTEARNMSLPLPAGGGTDLYLRRSQVTFASGFANGLPTVTIDIRAEVSLRDAVQGGRDLTDQGVLSRLQTELAAELTAQTKALIEALQHQSGSDVLGLHRLFADRHRDRWDTLKDDWTELFRRMPVTVRTDIVLSGSGLIAKYAPHDDADDGNALP